MMKRLLLIVLCVLCFSFHSHAEKRVAFIIGNSAYTGEAFSELSTPVNDAKTIAAKLTGLGFEKPIINNIYVDISFHNPTNNDCILRMFNPTAIDDKGHSYKWSDTYWILVPNQNRIDCTVPAGMTKTYRMVIKDVEASIESFQLVDIKGGTCLEVIQDNMTT